MGISSLIYSLRNTASSTGWRSSGPTLRTRNTRRDAFLKQKRQRQMPNNANSPKGNDPRRKVIRVRFNFSWLYLILILGIGWLLLNNSGANPQKIEWAEVQEMFLKGDIKEIDFVRNDFKGNITVRPDRLNKYADKFGGKVPASSPHFIFLVSDKFDAEKEFGELNAKLTPDESQVKIVMENDSRMWSNVLE